jgi:hypothetical protein
MMPAMPILRAKHAVLAALMIISAAGLGGCVMTEPLATEHLREEVKDLHVSIILLRFKSPPMPRNSFGFPMHIPWSFAVANESTGWNFRRLDYFSMIFHTHEDTLEPDTRSTETGWATFLAPPGLNYIAVTGLPGSGLEMDFINDPRFAVQVPQDQALIYAGTIERGNDCNHQKPATCSGGLTVVDETTLAEKFIERYPKGFAGAPPMQTQLLTIPQSRTIEIRNRPAATDRHGQ